MKVGHGVEAKPVGHESAPRARDSQTLAQQDLEGTELRHTH